MLITYPFKTQITKFYLAICRNFQLLPAIYMNN